jgi:hypothetical protein
VECKVVEVLAMVKLRAAISSKMASTNLVEVKDSNTEVVETTEEEVVTIITEDRTKVTTRATSKEVEVSISRIEATPTSRTTCNKWVACLDSSKCRIKVLLSSRWARLMATSSRS